jgi:hypothetical protein
MVPFLFIGWTIIDMQMQIKPSIFSLSWVLLVQRTGLSVDVKQVVELNMFRLEQVSMPVSLKRTLVVILQVLGMSMLLVWEFHQWWSAFAAKSGWICDTDVMKASNYNRHCLSILQSSFWQDIPSIFHTPTKLWTLSLKLMAGRWIKIHWALIWCAPWKTLVFLSLSQDKRICWGCVQGELWCILCRWQGRLGYHD